MNTEPLYVRGAFVAYASKDSKLTGAPPHIIPFRFNPESLSRTLSAQGESPKGMKEESTQSSTQVTCTVSPDTASTPIKESFSLKLRFDVHERDQTTGLLPPALGIMPELAALEVLMHPMMDDLSLLTKGAVTAETQRPIVLLVWGPRVLPVRILSMQVDETLHNAFLTPSRAEVNVSLEVLPAQNMGDVVKGAHDYMRIKRQVLARLFHATAVAQGGGILPL